MNAPEVAEKQLVPESKFLQIAQALVNEAKSQSVAIEMLKQDMQDKLALLEAKIETEVPINAPQVKALKKAVEIRAREHLKTDDRYKQYGKKLIRAIWTDLKDVFQVGQYREIPRVKFEEAMTYVKTWYPSNGRD
ncbi:MAG: hypothetical protein H6Q71_2905 [Firmicutes bacterium]|nr:hypothetical protein [Bacillota bacterium]